MLLEVIVMGKKKTSDNNSIRRKEKGEIGDMVTDLKTSSTSSVQREVSQIEKDKYYI